MTLLDDLLTHLISDKVHTMSELALEMDVSVDLLDQMLYDLERAGYLRAVERACGEQCTLCPERGICGVACRGRVWSMTEKGYRAVTDA